MKKKTKGKDAEKMEDVKLKQFQTIFGKNMRAVRLNRCLNQGEAAELAGMSRPRISEIEHGRWPPSLTIMVKFALVYGVEPHEFLDPRTEAKYPPHISATHEKPIR